MRLTYVLTKKMGRTPGREPVAFQEILPLKLRQQVSGKGDRTSEVSCLYEMSVLFACFQTNDFDQRRCTKEIDNFQSCYYNHLKKSQLKKEREAKGVLVPGERNLSHKQINKLLSMHPNVK